MVTYPGDLPQVGEEARLAAMEPDKTDGRPKVEFFHAKTMMEALPFIFNGLATQGTACYLEVAERRVRMGRGSSRDAP